MSSSVSFSLCVGSVGKVFVVCPGGVCVLWEDWEVSEDWGKVDRFRWVLVLALLLRDTGFAVEEGFFWLLVRVFVDVLEGDLLWRGFNLTSLLLLTVYE